MVVAIDGPAGAGKSTIARLIAQRTGFTFLNSGSFYRAITLHALRAGLVQADKSVSFDEKELLKMAETLDLDYQDGHLILNGEDVERLLHSDAIDLNSSRISCIVPVRHLVNKKIRQITEHLSIVCEGRDMTTVVFPDAQYKFYLDASIEAQAQRRFSQGVSNLSLQEIKDSIRQRDEIDKNKAEGSLRIAPDAHYIDTSDLTIDEVCEIITSKIHI